MKRVAIPGPEPSVLVEFRANNPAATWEDFKHQRGNEAVFDHLASAQGHICAYCEIQIFRGTEGEVEHYQPKSATMPGRNLHLDFSNLLACCEGGTRPWKTARAELPIAETQHCGALKGSKAPDHEMVDPRSLPVTCLPWRTTSQGFLVTNLETCASAGIDPSLAERALSFLGLNRRVLVRLRAQLLDQLLEDYADVPFDPEAMLLPDSQGHLQPFWSTVREFGGSEAEAFVSTNIERIPGLGVLAED